MMCTPAEDAPAEGLSKTALKKLKKKIPGGRKLLEMAAVLSDADLYPSFGAGPEANQEMSKRLSTETGMDLNNDKAQDFAQKNIMGLSFTSAAGRCAGNPNLEKDIKETRCRLKKQAGKKL